MDYEDILFKIGSFGKYQKLILYLVIFPAMLPCAFLVWNQVFMSGTPRNYWCRLPLENLTNEEQWRLLPQSINNEGIMSHDKCNMYDVDYSVELKPDNTMPKIPCKFGWVYDTTDYTSTIVTDWDLVCENHLAVTIGYAINWAGGLVSMYLIGFIGDRYGRKKAYFLNLVNLIIFSIATIFAPNFVWFCVFRFFVGVGMLWTYTLPMMIAVEIIGPEPRAAMAVVGSLYYTLGMMIIGGLSYLIPDWKIFGLASSLPLIAIFATYWIMPESPRWLLSQKRYAELANQFEKMARINGVTLSEEFKEDLPAVLKTIDSKAASKEFRADRKYSILDLFRTPNLRKNTLILIIANICNAGVYIGLSFYGPTLNENPHWNFFLSALAEMPGYLFTTLMCNKLGRRFSLVSTVMLAGLAGIAAAGVPATSTRILLGLVLVSKFAIAIAFVVSELMEDEVIPTVVRAEGHSATAFMSGLVTLGMPFIVFLGTQFIVLPLIIFGVTCIFTSFICLFLPETANTQLPQFLDEGEEMGKNRTWKQIFSFPVPKRRKAMPEIAIDDEMHSLRDLDKNSQVKEVNFHAKRSNNV